MRVALVHDWLTNQGGGERVLWELHQLYPEAPIYTSVYRAEKLPQFKDCRVITSFLQRLPLSGRHQFFPTLRRLAFESFDFKDFDVVISSSAAEAKGVITLPSTLHLGYIFTPTRYYWSDGARYFRNPGFGWLDPLIRLVMPWQTKKARQWDFAAAQRADLMVGISRAVSRRIDKYYRRPAEVIYPPVDVDQFTLGEGERNGYLVVSRLVPYKKVDLAVLACKKLDLPLMVIGQGSEMSRLKSLAGPKTRFMTEASDKSLAEAYAQAKGFIFPPDEDFGITPLEANAAGAPVIAYGQGGALETVKDGQTGVFFNEQSVGSLASALERFEKLNFDAQALRRHAETFSAERFRREIGELVKQEYARLSEAT